MSIRIANSTLNASTLDILNVIRQNASYDYQQNVPVVETAADIPKVGEIIYGTPAFANQFINALVNRIAMVRVKSATFNNPYSVLKKGYLEFGETVENIFVNIAKAVDYTPEKGPEREFKRTMPDVKSAFHTMNWRVVYPVTIQDEDLRMAFLSMEGVQDLIAKVVDAIYTGAEYDEFLLFKYLLIKAIAHGEMYPVGIGDGTDLLKCATQFRSMSNILPFIKKDYNKAGVNNNTPKDRQIIFMDAVFNAEFDVNVLASAFNMEKADFMGRLFLIDDWTSFDNERFEIIRANSDGLEEITDDEIALLGNVKAVLIDEDWFQVYDNNNKFTEKYVASGLYWNYFYHTWKTISSSPFANAVVFVTDSAITNVTPVVEVLGKEVSEEATMFILGVSVDGAYIGYGAYNFVQTEQATTDGVAIQPYGSVIFPATSTATSETLTLVFNGTEYTGALATSNVVGDVIIGG